jgi:hypothetical protein
MPTPGYVFKDSGTTPPAVDRHAEKKFPQQPAQLGPQTHSHVDPHTYAQFRPETNAQPVQTSTQHDQMIAPNGSRPLTPENTVSTADPALKDKAYAIVEDATQTLRKNFAADSQELAHENHEIKGAIQTHRDGESNAGVRDIGWHKPTVEVPDPLIGGLPNGRLWAMIRRFNKVREHIWVSNCYSVRVLTLL